MAADVPRRVGRTGAASILRRMRRVSTSDPTFTYDGSDPAGFRSGMFRPGPELGAKQTGATAYEVPPGQSICPYH